MSNFDALKRIYEALGGDEEITGTNLEALKAIAEVAGSGGGGGGGGVLIEEFTWLKVSDSEIYAVSTDTAEAIFAAFASGKNVILHIPAYEGYAFEEFDTMSGYVPAQTFGSSEWGPGFTFNGQTLSVNGNPSGNVLSSFASLIIDENGKMRLQLYID